MIEGIVGPQTARTPIIEESVLHSMDQNPGTGVRALAIVTERSLTITHHVLQGKALHLFRVQRVQLLQLNYHP